eukprot:ANDGO_02648.mRNA.1 hypothetical protein
MMRMRLEMRMGIGMNVLIVAWIGFSCFAARTVHAQSAKRLPSYVLGNWKDTVAYWSASENCPHAKSENLPGFSYFAKGSFSSAGSSFSASVISADSFAVEFDGTVYADPTQFSHVVTDGGVVLRSNGEFEAVFNSYGGKQLPFELAVRTYMPPGADYYATEFAIEPLAAGVHTGHIVSFLYAASACLSAVSAVEFGAFVHDLHFCAGGPSEQTLVSMYLGESMPTSPSSLLVAAEAGQVGTVLAALQSGHLANSSSAQASNAGLESAFAVSFSSSGPSEKRVFSIIRSIQSSTEQAQAWIKSFRSANLTMNSIIATTAQAYSAFLNSGKLAKLSAKLSPNEIAMYEHSLLALKNGQNPLNGAIMASFHPLYGYKVWSRDAVFAAIIFAAAGYPAESRLFLQWASQAELRSDSAFHTCYNFADGSVNGFVEPQYDGTGLYLVSVLYYLRETHDLSILSAPSVQDRVRTFEQFFIQNKGFNQLSASDYSIWEESSDQHSGAPLPTQYYAFSQVMAWAGLRAAGILESSEFLSNPQAAAAVQQRQSELQSAIMNNMFDYQQGYMYRGRWSDTNSPDTRVDSSSTAAIFMGLLSQNSTMSKSLLSNVYAQLTRWDNGIGRYVGDGFFFDSKWDPCGSEVGQASPPWGVTTMFTAFAELSLGLPIDKRIKFMLDSSAAEFSPVGEAVDGLTGQFVRASAPDIYEHGGVFILAQLLRYGLATPLWSI